MSFRFRKAALAVPLVVVALVSACSSDSDKSSGSSSSSPAKAPFYDMLPDKIKTAGVLTWVGDLQAPLRIQVNAGDPLTGVQADFAAAMSKLLGVRIDQPIVASFDEVIPSVQSGRYDMAWGGLADTADREKTFDVITWTFSVPTFVFPPAKSYKTALDLCGLKLAHVSGSTPFTNAFTALNGACTAAGKSAATDVALAARADLQLAVASGRADAYFTTPIDGAYSVKQAPDKFKLIVLKDAPFHPDQLAAEFAKGNTQLRDALLAAMKKMFADKTYDTIMKKWGLEDAEIAAPLLNPLSSATSSSAVASPSTSK
jgi:polar amino acid transport system substrate-binding protein